MGERTVRNLVIMGIAILMMATPSFAGRHVTGVGTLTPEVHTDALVAHLARFDAPSATGIRVDGEVEPFPHWLTGSLLEWDSEADYTTSGMAMQAARDAMADRYFPGGRFHALGVVTSPVHVHVRMQDAGLRELPEPFRIFPGFYSVVFTGWDFLRFGSSVSRADLSSGMPVHWRERVENRLLWRNVFDDVGIFLGTSGDESWVVQADPIHGLTFEAVEASRFELSGAVTLEARTHDRAHPGGAGFGGLDPGESVALPGDGNVDWRLVAFPFGDQVLWRLAPEAWEADTVHPLLREERAYYFRMDETVVPYVVVHEFRSSAGDTTDTRLEVTGIGVSREDVALEVERIGFRNLPSTGPIASGQHLVSVAGHQIAASALSGTGLALEQDAIRSTRALSSGWERTISLRQERAGETLLVRLASGAAYAQAPRLFHDGDRARFASGSGLRLSGGVPSHLAPSGKSAALGFDGDTPPMEIPGAMDQPDGGISLGFWFRSEPVSDGGRRVLAYKRVRGDDAGFDIHLRKEAGAPLVLRTELVGGALVDPATFDVEGPFDDGNWHHYAMRITGGSTPSTRVFVNGVAWGDAAWGARMGGDDPLAIGGIPGGRARDRLHGEIDSLHLFGAPLADGEMRRLHLDDLRREDRVVLTSATYGSAVPPGQGAPFVIGSLPVLPEGGVRVSGEATDADFRVDEQRSLVLAQPWAAGDGEREFEVRLSVGSHHARLPVRIRGEDLSLREAPPWFFDAVRLWDRRLDWRRSVQEVVDVRGNVFGNPHIARLKNAAHCATSGTFANRFNGYCNEFLHTLMLEAGVTDLPVFVGTSRVRKIRCTVPHDVVRTRTSVAKGRNFAVWGEDVSGAPAAGDVIAVVRVSGADYSQASLNTFHTTFHSHESKDGRYVWTLGGNQSGWVQFKRFLKAPMAGTFVRRSGSMTAGSGVRSPGGSLFMHWNPGNAISYSETGRWEVQEIDFSDPHLVAGLRYPKMLLSGTFFRIVPAGTPRNGPPPATGRVHYVMKEYPQERDPVLVTEPGGFRIE